MFLVHNLKICLMQEESDEKEEPLRFCEEDTGSEQLMFEMDGDDGRKLRCRLVCYATPRMPVQNPTAAFYSCT